MLYPGDLMRLRPVVYRKTDAGQRHYLSPIRVTFCGIDTSVAGWDVDIKGGLATCETCLFVAKVLDSDAGGARVNNVLQEIGMNKSHKEARDRRITEFLLEHELKEALTLVDELVREHEISIQTKVDEGGRGHRAVHLRRQHRADALRRRGCARRGPDAARRVRPAPHELFEDALTTTGNRMIYEDIMLPMSEFERVMRLDLRDMAAGHRGKSIPEHWADVVQWALEPRSAKRALSFAACILGTHALLSFVARCRKET